MLNFSKVFFSLACFFVFQIIPVSLAAEQVFEEEFDDSDDLEITLCHDFQAKSKSKKSKSSKKSLELAICAIYWNPEVPYLKEWIEYHRTVGVEHFFLFNNIWWEDNSMEVLEPYVKMGVVTVIPWKCKPDHLGVWDPGQRAAYNKGLELTRGKYKWTAFIDIDEFIVPTDTTDLRVFLKDFEKHPAILLNWQFYGTSGYDDIPKDKLMTECLIYKLPTYHGLNGGVKCIVQPGYIKEMTVHLPYVYNLKECEEAGLTTYPVNEKGAETGRDGYWSLSVDRIRVNHYWYRTNNYYRHVKLPLRNKWCPDTNNAQVWDAFLEEATVCDPAISPFIPELRRRMGLR